MSKPPQNYKFLFRTLHNYYDVISPFNYVSRCFGLSAIQPSFQLFAIDNKFPIFKIISRYIGVVFWSIYFFSFMRINYLENYFQTISPNEIANNGRRMLLFFGITMCFIVIVSTHFLTAKCVVLIKRILEFDRELKSLGTDVDLRRESMLLTIYVFITMIMCVVTVSFSAAYLDKWESFKLFFCMHVPFYVFNWNYIIFVNRFMVFSFSIIYRYRILNESLWIYLMVRQGKYFEFVGNSKAVKYGSVYDYARLHGLLTDCVGDVNRCYAVQLMIIIGGVFSYFITTVFTIFMTFVFGDCTLMELTSWFSTWCIFYTIPIISVIAAGSSVQRNVCSPLHLHIFITNNCFCQYCFYRVKKLRS